MHTDISGARWIWAKASGSRLRETLMPACLWHPSSSRPDEKVSLRTRGAIRRLKSHLRRLHSSCLFFPSSVLLSIWPSRLSAPHLPISCSCGEGHRHLHCPPSSSPLVLLHPTRSHLPPAQDTGPWVLCLPRRGPFIRRSARPSEPLIPSSLHPVTKEWLGAEGTQSACCEGQRFKQRQTESAQVIRVQGQVFWVWIQDISAFRLHASAL